MKIYTGRSYSYQFISKIAPGGFSDVWKATRSDGLVVAVKLFKSKYAKSVREIQLLMAYEGKFTGQLNHENICRVLDFIHVENDHGLVFEYLEGDNLSKHLKKSELGLSEQEAMRISINVLRALEHAHQNDVVHRDINPNNIMVTNVGDVKLIDFGMTGTLLNRDELRHFSKFITKGYMAEELFEEGSFRPEKYHKGHDLFSLGVVFQQMLTSKVCSRLLRKSDCSQEIKDLVARWLHEDPSSRFSSANEIVLELERLLLHTTPRVSSSQKLINNKPWTSITEISETILETAHIERKESQVKFIEIALKANINLTEKNINPGNELLRQLRDLAFNHRVNDRHLRQVDDFFLKVLYDVYLEIFKQSDPGEMYYIKFKEFVLNRQEILSLANQIFTYRETFSFYELIKNYFKTQSIKTKDFANVLSELRHGLAIEELTLDEKNLIPEQYKHIVELGCLRASGEHEKKFKHQLHNQLQLNKNKYWMLLDKMMTYPGFRIHGKQVIGQAEKNSIYCLLAKVEVSDSRRPFSMLARKVIKDISRELGDEKVELKDYIKKNMADVVAAIHPEYVIYSFAKLMKLILAKLRLTDQERMAFREIIIFFKKRNEWRNISKTDTLLLIYELFQSFDRFKYHEKLLTSIMKSLGLSANSIVENIILQNSIRMCLNQKSYSSDELNESLGYLGVPNGTYEFDDTLMVDVYTFFEKKSHDEPKAHYTHSRIRSWLTLTEDHDFNLPYFVFRELYRHRVQVDPNILSLDISEDRMNALKEYFKDLLVSEKELNFAFTDFHINFGIEVNILPRKLKKLA